MIVLLPWIPILSALILMAVPRDRKNLLRQITLFSCASCFLITLWLVTHFPLDGGFHYVHRYSWIPSLGITYQVGVDGINMTLVLLHALVSLAGAFVAGWIEKRPKDYLIFYLILVGAIYGVFTALDIFFLYLFYEMTLIPLYPMIGKWGSNVSRGEAGEYSKEYGAMKLTIFITAGAVIALFGILLLYVQTGKGSFDLLYLQSFLRETPLSANVQILSAALFLIGFGVITSLWPLHSWSPIGYAVAPTSVSMIHAGVLKKMGPYLILRLAVGLLPEGTRHWSSVLAVLAVIGILYAGYAAMRQKDLKFMLGFSSVSHMGYILLGIAAMTPIALSGVVLLMFSHGVMAAASFALIGFLYEQAHVRGLDDFGGLGKKLPFVGICFVMASLASLGLPGFSNFVAELLIFIGTWGNYPILVALAIFGILITAIYLLRAVQQVFYGPKNPRWEGLKDASGFYEKFPFILLLGALILFGFWPQGLLRMIQPAVEALLP